MDIDAPFVSVVVPIYNVAPWLRKCLNSLMRQTLKEIEIICIDDGSTDESGKIADEYGKDDPRFKIIHTENKGLSAARNLGIEEAKAEWLMFVDSDDWVDGRFCEIPYKTALENDADLVIFRSVGEIFKVVKKKWMNNKDYPFGIVDEFTAYKYGNGVAWNKLYKKVLFSGISYPDGRVYEDLATTHKLIHVSSRIVMIKEYLYHHIVRNRSISHTHTDLYRIDGFVSAKEKHAYLISLGYPKEMISSSLCGYAMGYMLTNKCTNDKELFLYAKNMLDSVLGIPKEIPLLQRAAFVIFKKNRMLFRLFCKITNPF